MQQAENLNVAGEALILLINLALNGFETLAHIINIQYQRSGLAPDLIRLLRWEKYENRCRLAFMGQRHRLPRH